MRPDHLLIVRFSLFVVKEGAEEQERPALGIPPLKHQIVQAEIVFIIDHVFLGHKIHDPRGKTAVVEVFKKLAPELEVQRLCLRGLALRPQLQQLHAVSAEDIPQDVPQIHKHHNNPTNSEKR